MKRALELDPLSIAANTWYEGMLHNAGRGDEAIAQLQKSLKVAGNVPITHFWLGRRYLGKKMNREAIDEFRTAVTLSRDQPFYLAWLGYAYAVSGRTDEAGRILNQLTKSPAAPMFQPMKLRFWRLRLPSAQRPGAPMVAKGM
jgi:tetratricopeptide (TPR) repeat protein